MKDSHNINICYRQIVIPKCENLIYVKLRIRNPQKCNEEKRTIDI